MRYDDYERRVKKIGQILNKIYKRRVPIIITASIGLVTGAALFSTKGILSDVTLGENQIVYGEEVPISGDAFIGATVKEYLVKGNWTEDEPTAPGTYCVRLRSKNNFGGYYYSEEYEFSIIQKDAEIKVADNQYVEYGSLPRIEFDGLCSGDSVDFYKANYDNILDFTTGCIIDKSSLVIKNSKGIDVTSSYNLTFTKGTINFMTKRVDIEFEGATKEYDGQPLSNSNYTITDLAFDDYLDTSVLTLPTVYNCNETVSNDRGTIIIRTKEGADITDHYNIYKKSDELRINKRALNIISNDLIKTYDGSPFSSNSFEYEFQNGTKLANGDSIVNVYFENQYEKDACYRKNTFTFDIIDSDYNIITDTHYDVKCHFGTFDIQQRQINISYNNSKTYDGYDLVTTFPETSDSYILDTSTLANSDYVVCKYKYDEEKNSVHTFVRDGKPTLVFSIFDSYGTDVTFNYDITFDTEYFEVEKRKLVLTLFNQSKYYDGTADLYDIEDSQLYSVVGLAPDDYITSANISFTNDSYGTQANAGSHKIAFDKNYPVSIYNSRKGTDVTDDYKIEYYNNGEATYEIKTPTIDINFNTSENVDYFKYKYEYEVHSFTNLLDSGRYIFLTDSNSERVNMTLDEVLAPGDYVVISKDFAETNIGSYNFTPTISVYSSDGRDVSSNYKINNSRTYTFVIQARTIDINFTGDFSPTYQDIDFTLEDMFRNGEFTVNMMDLPSGYSLEIVQYSTMHNVSDSGKVDYDLVITYHGVDVSNNFDIKKYDYYFDIQQAVIDFALPEEKFTFVYDDKDHTLNMMLSTYLETHSVNNLVEGHTLYFESDNRGHNVSESGKIDYTFKVLKGYEDVTSNYSYNTSAHNYYYDISPRVIDIKFKESALSFTYDGEYHSLQDSYESGDVDSIMDLVEGHSIYILSDYVKNVSDSGPCEYSIKVYKETDGTPTDVTENYLISYYYLYYNIIPYRVEGRYINDASTFVGQNTIVNEYTHTISFTYDGYERNLSSYYFSASNGGYSYLYTKLEDAILSNQHLDDSKISYKGSRTYYDYGDSFVEISNVVILDNEGNVVTQNYDLDLATYTYIVSKRQLDITYDDDYFDNWHYGNHTYSAAEAYNYDFISTNTGGVATTDILTISGWEKKYISDVETPLVYSIENEQGINVENSYCINNDTGFSLPRYTKNKVDSIVVIDDTQELFQFTYDGKKHSLESYYSLGLITSSLEFDGEQIYIEGLHSYFDTADFYNVTHGAVLEDLNSTTFILETNYDSNSKLAENFNYIFKLKTSGDEITYVEWNITPIGITYYIPGLSTNSVKHYTYDGTEKGGVSDWRVTGELADNDYILFDNSYYYSTSYLLNNPDFVLGAITNHNQENAGHVRVNPNFEIHSDYYDSEFSLDNYVIVLNEYDIEIDQIDVDIFFNYDFDNIVFDEVVRNFSNEYTLGNYEQDGYVLTSNGEVLTIQTYRCDSDGSDEIPSNVSFTYVYNPVTEEYESGYYKPSFSVKKGQEDKTCNYNFAEHVYRVEITPKKVDINFNNFGNSSNYFTWNFDNKVHSFNNIIEMDTFSSENDKLLGYTMFVTNEPDHDSYSGFKYVSDSVTDFVPEIGIYKGGYNFAENFLIVDNHDNVRTYDFTCSPFDVYVYYGGFNPLGTSYDKNSEIAVNGVINVEQNYGYCYEYQDEYGNWYTYSLNDQFLIDSIKSNINLLNLSENPTLIFNSGDKTYLYSVSDSGIYKVTGICAINDDGEIPANNFDVYCYNVSFNILPKTILPSSYISILSSANTIQYYATQTKSIFDQFHLLNINFSLGAYDYYLEEAFPVTDGTAAYDGLSAWPEDDLQIYRDYYDENGVVAINVTSNYQIDNSTYRTLSGLQFELVPTTLEFYIDSSYFETCTAISSDTYNAKFIYDGDVRDCTLFDLDNYTESLLEQAGVSVKIDTENIATGSIQYCGGTNKAILDITGAVSLWRDGIDITNNGEYIISSKIYDVEIFPKIYTFIADCFGYFNYELDSGLYDTRSLEDYYNIYLDYYGGDNYLIFGDYIEIVSEDVPNLIGDFTPSYQITFRNADGVNISDSYILKFSNEDGLDTTCQPFKGRYSTIEFVLDTSKLVDKGDHYEFTYNGQNVYAKDLFIVEVTYRTDLDHCCINHYSIEEFFANYSELNAVDWNDYCIGSLTFNDTIQTNKEFYVDVDKLINETNFDDYFYIKGSDTEYISLQKKNLSFDSLLGYELNDGANSASNPIKVLYNGNSYGYSVTSDWKEYLYSIEDYYDVATGDIIFSQGGELASGDIIVFYSGLSNEVSVIRDVVSGSESTIYYTNANSYKIYRYVDGAKKDVTDRYFSAEIPNYYYEIVRLEIRETISDFENAQELYSSIGNNVDIPYTGKKYNYSNYQLEFKDLDGEWRSLNLNGNTLSCNGLYVFGEERSLDIIKVSNTSATNGPKPANQICNTWDTNIRVHFQAGELSFKYNGALLENGVNVLVEQEEYEVKILKLEIDIKLNDDYVDFVYDGLTHSIQNAINDNSENNFTFTIKIGGEVVENPNKLKSYFEGSIYAIDEEGAINCKRFRTKEDFGGLEYISETARYIIMNNGEIVDDRNIALNNSPRTYNWRMYVPEFNVVSSDLPSHSLDIDWDSLSLDTQKVDKQYSGSYYGYDSFSIIMNPTSEGVPEVLDYDDLSRQKHWEVAVGNFIYEFDILDTKPIRDTFDENNNKSIYELIDWSTFEVFNTVTGEYEEDPYMFVGIADSVSYEIEGAPFDLEVFNSDYFMFMYDGTKRSFEDYVERYGVFESISLYLLRYNFVLTDLKVYNNTELASLGVSTDPYGDVVRNVIESGTKVSPTYEFIGYYISDEENIISLEDNFVFDTKIYTYSIEKRPIDILFDESYFELVYDGEEHSLDNLFNDNNTWSYNGEYKFVDSLDVSIFGPSFKNANDYNYTRYIVDDYSFVLIDKITGDDYTNNYDLTLTYEHEYEFIIHRRPIDLEFDPSCFDIVYDGHYHSLSELYEDTDNWTINGEYWFCGEHCITFEESKSFIDVKDSGPFEYSIIIKDANGNDVTSNYDLTDTYNHEYEFNISKKLVSIVPDSTQYDSIDGNVITFTYDTNTRDGRVYIFDEEYPLATTDYCTFANYDETTVKYVSDSGKIITVDLANLQIKRNNSKTGGVDKFYIYDNYDVNYEEYIWKVLPYEMTIDLSKILNGDFVYDEESNKYILEFTYDGFDRVDAFETPFSYEEGLLPLLGEDWLTAIYVTDILSAEVTRLKYVEDSCIIKEPYYVANYYDYAKGSVNVSSCYNFSNAPIEVIINPRRITVKNNSYTDYLGKDVDYYKTSMNTHLTVKTTGENDIVQSDIFGCALTQEFINGVTNGGTSVKAGSYMPEFEYYFFNTEIGNLDSNYIVTEVLSPYTIKGFGIGFGYDTTFTGAATTINRTVVADGKSTEWVKIKGSTFVRVTVTLDMPEESITVYTGHYEFNILSYSITDVNGIPIDLTDVEIDLTGPVAFDISKADLSIKSAFSYGNNFSLPSDTDFMDESWLPKETLVVKGLKGTNILYIITDVGQTRYMNTQKDYGFIPDLPDEGRLYCVVPTMDQIIIVDKDGNDITDCYNIVIDNSKAYVTFTYDAELE